jgi:AbrB family looped-hinge helix DNA binding protein
MNKLSERTYTTTIEDAADGSGDGILTIPPEVCEDFGWSEGTVLNIEIVNGEIILEEANNVQSNTTSS